MISTSLSLAFSFLILVGLGRLGNIIENVFTAAVRHPGRKQFVKICDGGIEAQSGESIPLFSSWK